MTLCPIHQLGLGPGANDTIELPPVQSEQDRGDAPNGKSFSERRLLVDIDLDEPHCRFETTRRAL